MYHCLFSEGKIGAVTIKNRIVMTAAGCEKAHEDGTIPKEYIAYYEERAKGGVGAIITELVQVNGDTGVMNHNQVRVHEDYCIEQLRPLTQRIHQYGCKLFLQMQHPGNVTTPERIHGRIPVSASDVSNLIFQQPVRPMTVAEIQELVEQFGDGAHRAQKAGVDGVEIHAAHFYLIHQFITPYFNKRTDAYGGSRENRMRLLKEIIENIRKKCGSEFAIIVRISVEEFLPEGGYHLNEGIELCRMAERYGADAIDVTVAGTGCRYGQSLEPISYEQGWRRFVARAVKRFVNIPVIGVSVVREPDFAEQMLTEETVDFVGSARNFLADPEWANKARSGRENEIRRCISCLKCIQGVVNGEGIGCSVNPLCGNEAAAREMKKDGNHRKVIVIGGGPSGMQAACTAAERGFSVKLYEQRTKLGGQLRFAAAAPHKEKITWFISYLKAQMERLRVEVQTETRPTLEMLKEEQPYAVIDATGAVPVIPKAFAADRDFVHTPDEILSGKIRIQDSSVVIVGSGMTGLETAEFLSEKNNFVVMIEMDDRIARAAYSTQVTDVMKYLETHNVITMTSTALNTIEDGYITVRNVRTDEVTPIPTEHVILSLGVRNPNVYGSELQDNFEHVQVVGDAAKSGRIVDAVSSGYCAAMAL